MHGGVMPRSQPTPQEQEEVEERESMLVAEAGAKLTSLVSWGDVRDQMGNDRQLADLATQVEQGFPPDKKLVVEGLLEFWRFREDLSLVEGVVLYKGRVVVLRPLRKAVLETLHSAHQGVYGMLLRADQSVWWPGMAADIRQTRAQCVTCDKVAPVSPRGPQ